MNYTQGLLTAYHAVCERQRESAVRNSALVQDLERIRIRLSQGPREQKTLATLKARYDLYLRSVYPQWVAQYKCSHDNKDNSRSVEGKYYNHDDPTPDIVERPIASPAHSIEVKVQSNEPSPQTDQTLHPDALGYADTVRSTSTAKMPLTMATPPSTLPVRAQYSVRQNDVSLDLSLSSYSLTHSKDELSAPPCSTADSLSGSQTNKHAPLSTSPAPHTPPAVSSSSPSHSPPTDVSSPAHSSPTNVSSPAHSPPADTPYPSHSPPADIPSPAHSPPADTPSPAHSPPTNVSSPAHSPPVDTPSPSHSPPTNVPSPAHSPPADIPSPAHSPPADTPFPSHSPPADTPFPSHSPPAGSPSPSHSPPADIPSPAHSPPADTPSPAHSPPTNVSSPAHSPPVDTPSPSHSPPTNVPSPAHSPPADIPSPAHSPPADTPFPYHSPPADTPFPSHSPPAGSPSRAHSPPADTPYPAHSPPADTPSPAHSPPTNVSSPAHSPPTNVSSPAHSPPADTPSPAHSPPADTPFPSHSPPAGSRSPTHSPPADTQSPSHSPPADTPSPVHSPPADKSSPAHSSPPPPLQTCAETVNFRPEVPPRVDSIVSKMSESSQSMDSSHAQLDRPTIIVRLLTTLNNHLREEAGSVAMEMYSEPHESDRMKMRISSSRVLSNNIVKCASDGGDTSTWDPSAVALVVLQQLSLMSASHGGPLPDHLITEEAPLITHPVDVSVSWSTVWCALLEHVQLLAHCNRPLDELAAIFTPALVTNPATTEKSCQQLFTILQCTLNGSQSELSEDDSLSEVLSPERNNAQIDLGLSDHSSLLSEGSAVAELERELQTVMITKNGTNTSQPAYQQEISDSDSSVATPQGYVPTAIENSAPLHPSQLSNNSSLRRRLGFYDDSDSDLSDEQNDLLTPRNTRTENIDDDFDFYG